MSFQSYPLGYGSCRFLNYPVIDIFYDACDVAGVRCQHTASFQDPCMVLRSTSMNHEFTPKSDQLKIIQSMLNIVRGQLLSHPDRLAACWDSDSGDAFNMNLGDDIKAEVSANGVSCHAGIKQDPPTHTYCLLNFSNQQFEYV